MSIATLILSTLSRRPGRTFLMALGPALGVATIVALLAVADGARRSAAELVHLGRADIGLFQKDAADLATSILPVSLERGLLLDHRIAAVAPLQLLIESIPRDQSAVVFGGRPGDFVARRMVFSAGRRFRRPDEIVVGDGLASHLHLDVGSALVVMHHRFRVTGIYHAGVLFQDRGAFMSLADAQRLVNHPNEATTIAVQLAPGEHAVAVKRAIEARYPGLQAVTDVGQAPRAGANSELIDKAAVVIALLALLVGGIGVMNTMLMAVIERRSEFALLSAIGWSSPEVAGLVLAEGVAVSLLGAALGLVLGVLGARVLVEALGASAFVRPVVTDWGLGRGLLVGVGIGILGGVYPAWRASRTAPAAALAQR
ncbi:MAG: ABC transporter permease [Solirubrobacteraceae bacterium]